MLTRILADNFRALVNFEFRPGKLCLLLGDNGSGKSSLFEVLASISDLVVRGRPVSELFQGSQTRWDTRDVQRFELDVEGPDGVFRYALEIKQSPDKGNRRPSARKLSPAMATRCTGSQMARSTCRANAAGLARDFPFQSNQSFLANLDTRAFGLGGSRRSSREPRSCSQIHLGWKGLLDGSSQSSSRWCRNLPSYFDHLNSERPDARSALERRFARSCQVSRISNSP